MRTFAAIAIQTANHAKSSICAIGIVIVKNGVIVDRIYRLVRPTPNFYADWTIAQHGITCEDTMNEPNFVDVWSELAPKLRRKLIIAHNVDFVEGSIIAAHDIYAMRLFKYNYYSAIRATRTLYPELPNHTIEEIAKLVDFDSTGVNSVLANAEVCALIALNFLPEIENKIRNAGPTKRAIVASKIRKVKPRVVFEAQQRISAAAKVTAAKAADQNKVKKL